MGPKTIEFEEAFKSNIGIQHAISVNSGTAALNLSLLTLGIKKGDEVIVPLPDQRKEYEVLRVITVHDNLGENKE